MFVDFLLWLIGPTLEHTHTQPYIYTIIYIDIHITVYIYIYDMHIDR